MRKIIGDDDPYNSYKVIGRVGGAKNCDEITGDKYYVFYQDGGTVRVANCNNALRVLDKKSSTELLVKDNGHPITFIIKRFTHNVPATATDGTASVTARDLYFVATSLAINPEPFPGWTNFAAANPSFPLVTNNANTKIPFTSQVLSDLREVNLLVNSTHERIKENPFVDDWRIMEEGESGDCEDFALTKAKLLLDKGYPASALHIEAGLIPESAIPNFGHVWLVVQTTEGDYALDVNSNNVAINSKLKIDGKEFFCRRRQIGLNWASISPFAWMMASVNQPAPYMCWYILDPVLNIFYRMDGTRAYSSLFATISNLRYPNQVSSPSVNFSEDNNHIYTADTENIKTFKLEENRLTLVNTQPYTVKGFVGRDGQIVEGVGLYGRQDPFNYGGVELIRRTVDGNLLYLFSSISDARLGDFRCLYDCEVVSEDGYYSYNYKYLTGTFRKTGIDKYRDRYLIEWEDLDNPGAAYNHEQSEETFRVIQY